MGIHSIINIRIINQIPNFIIAIHLILQYLVSTNIYLTIQR